MRCDPYAVSDGALRSRSRMVRWRRDWPTGPFVGFQGDAAAPHAVLLRNNGFTSRSRSTVRGESVGRTPPV